MNKLFVFSFAMLCCLYSVCFAGTGCDLNPPVHNYQNMVCDPSRFDIAPYVRMVVDAIRVRDASQGSQEAIAAYNAKIDSIKAQILEARRNQYRAACCCVSRGFHSWASDARIHLTKGQAHKFANGTADVNAPDGSWELETPLDTIIHAKKDVHHGYVHISAPRRDGNRVLVDISVKGPRTGHSDNYVYGDARGQYKLTAGFIENKVNQELPYIWERVNAALGNQW